MAILLAIPILGLLLVVQSAVISQLPLLRGSPDLVLLAVLAWSLQKRVETAWHWAVIGGLLVTLISAQPVGLGLVGILLATAIALLLKRSVWQNPMLSMLVAVFLGTLATHLLTLIVLRVMGTALPIFQSLNLITLPSLFLNLVLAVPAFAVFGDLASWLYPEELEA